MIAVNASDTQHRNRGEVVRERLWRPWRRHQADVSARIRWQERELEQVQRLAESDDVSISVYEGAVSHERFKLELVRAERVGVMMHFLWLGLVSLLSFALVPLSDRFNNWMSSPDAHRQ